MRISTGALLRTGLLTATGALLAQGAANQVTIDSGVLEGAANSDQTVRIFRGVPFAAPPVGDLRWKEPQPAAHWDGVRKADEFGSRCYQRNIFGDMLFRSKGMSEDCLTLNIWAPSRGSHLPVLVYFYGGGFAAGAGDEPRYDGENFARKGIVAVTINYRLGVFGFLAHPELTAESPHKASGNYGMLDQVAALEWVKRNIAAFGGNPGHVTIGGESAGSFAVSGVMASPLAHGLIHGAIGESGAMFNSALGPLRVDPLSKAEENGTKFATEAGAKSLADLRAMPAADLLKAGSHGNPVRFAPIVDGYFLPADPKTIYAEGKQSHVPLLAGWNADEVRFGVYMAPQKPNAKTFSERMHQQFGDQGDAALKVYPAATDEEAFASAGDLASDLFIDYCTWKWIELQAKTGKSKVFRFEFDRAVPLEKPLPNGPKGLAGHSWELEYVFGALDSKKVAWTDEDRKTSETMASYFANFIKTGDPNGAGLPKWPAYGATHEVMHLDATSHAAPDEHRARYEFLDAYNQAH